MGGSFPSRWWLPQCFLMESTAVEKHWKTSMNVGALVTIVAAVHYFYMREFWVIIGTSPILYRYIDWSITVPLQMIEFYLILSAVNPSLSGMMFWRLLLGTVAMLAFGYAGEAQFVNPWVGFCAGMCGWFLSCSRSSQVKLVTLHQARTSTWLLLSAPCVSSSQWVGLSTLWVISLDISWAVSRTPL